MKEKKEKFLQKVTRGEENETNNGESYSLMEVDLKFEQDFLCVFEGILSLTDFW